MGKVQKVLLGVVIAGVVVVAILLWVDNRESRVSAPQATEAPVPPRSAEPRRTTVLPDHFRNPTPEPITNENPPNVSPVVSSTGLITNWEDRVDEIIGPEGNESEKVKQLLEMFPHLPEDGQVEVAQHLSNLVPDENYEPLGKILKDAKMPEAVLDVLLADLLNRPNSVKLPTILEVASNPQNPKASEAKDLLELFLEEDYGADWPKWQAKMDEWLKENPD
jgi:hypothetical protein